MSTQLRAVFIFFITATLTLLGACSDDGVDNPQQDANSDGSSDVTDPNSFSFEDSIGPLGVGHRTFSVTGTEASGNAPIITEVWYPTNELGSDDASLASFVSDGDDSAAIQTLLNAADATCTRKTVAGIRDAAYASPAYDSPILLFSHCLGCTRFSSATIAEALASYGFIVIAPDHGGNTYFDESPALNAAALARRIGEVEAILQFVEDADENSAEPAESLIAKGDKANLGMFGHSFGSITTGNIAADHPEILAIAGLAAPFDALGDVNVEDLDLPVLFELMQEDNSITEFGNILIRGNFDKTSGPTWIFEIPDAGHFSVSSLCGIDSGFTACCGDAKRQTEAGVDFTYPAAQSIRDLVASDVSAFFSAELLGSTSARTYITNRTNEREDNKFRE